MLGPDPAHCGPNMQNQFFYTTPLISQRLAVLKQMVEIHPSVIVVTGQEGSGKTSLINQYINEISPNWRKGRIHLKRQYHRAYTLLRHLNNRKVFVSTNHARPSIIVDDAHEFNHREMEMLLRWAYPHNGAPTLQSIILIADAQMRTRFAEIAAHIPAQAAIDKIHMTPLTDTQTAAYLHHRIKTAGFSENLTFSKDQITTIHQLSGGWPGMINREAYMQLKKAEGAASKKYLSRIWAWLFNGNGDDRKRHFSF